MVDVPLRGRAHRATKVARLTRSCHLHGATKKGGPPQDRPDASYATRLRVEAAAVEIAGVSGVCHVVVVVIVIVVVAVVVRLLRVRRIAEQCAADEIAEQHAAGDTHRRLRGTGKETAATAPR